MYKVIISTECGSNQKGEFIITKSFYNKLVNLKNSGGFNRFALDLYDDNVPKCPHQNKWAHAFLKANIK